MKDKETEVRRITIAKGDDSFAKKSKLTSGDVLGVLPLRNMVLFPGVLLPVTVTRPASQRLVKMAWKQEKLIAVVTQRDAAIQEPCLDDLYALGTAARVVRTIELPDDSLMAILEGLDRIQLGDIESKTPYMKAQVTVIPEQFPKRGNKQFMAIVTKIKDIAKKILKRTENMPQEATFALKNIDSAPTLVNYVCVNFDIKIAEKQALLVEDDIQERALRLLPILMALMQQMDVQESIQQKAQEGINKQQREYFLQQQMQTIQQELGDTSTEVINDMRRRGEKKKWTEAIAKVFDAELKKLERMSSHSPEYATQQNYLETMLSLPWGDYTKDNYDIKHAKKVLEEDHYGMEKVKERIIEFLAVQKQLHETKKDGNIKSPILCLYGPPGVGKTSLGKSIARALGRKYARISFGGLHDESEIRGHRRTYIGAMPGRIIENLKKVQSSNPVFVLDEIDKIGMDYKGDPTSALLEVLDPEQNTTFHDNFLDVEYDLSKVLFIATANTLDTIPRPLLDRMELIEMTGYLQEEKVEIAKRHLLPKEMKNHGLTSKEVKLSKEVINELIDKYTRESGVRGLEREIASVMRKVVTKMALEEEHNVNVTKEDLQKYLGKPRFTRDLYEGNKYVGVVTGLAWTQVGGEILYIETSLSQSKSPTLTLTGNLGDVMKESATLALGYIKAHATEFGISQTDLDSMAVHIHVPEGAIPKDGPSAGITITTALVSAFTERTVRERIAMTGEMTLRGKVLPIGGVKEKLLAAKRAGITDIVLCEENRKDVEEIPENYLSGLTFHYVTDIQEVIDFSLLPK